MQRHVPNQLTLLRLILAALFFVTVNQYRYGDPALAWVVLLAAGVFILAALTDVLDGYLARRWQVESVFGRIMDPFCDKVLILGAFIYLAGPRFIAPGDAGSQAAGAMVSGVYPWMVVLILARELLVTATRGELERENIAFGANIWGKMKMLLQSVTVPAVLVIVYLDPHQPGRAWMGAVRDGLVYLTVLVTLVSGWPYVVQGGRAMARGR